MLYWISFIILFVSSLAVLLCLLHMLKNKRKHDYMEKETFVVFIVIFCVILFFLIYMSTDIPSALSGGQDLYVNELPTRIVFGPHVSYVDTDNEELKHLSGCDWNAYEKYGNYHIRYTKHTKFVLDIEKLD